MLRYKNSLCILIACIFVFGCKKQKSVNPDDTIVYTHIYKTRSDSLDTLFSVYIPNAFTPNWDGINDYFQIKGYFNLNSLKILNKYNNLIYETDYKDFSWDGKQAGYSTMQGSYVYKLNISDAINRQYEYTGTFMLYK